MHCIRPPAFVPFGETWKGKACGPVTFDDPIPSENYDAMSLGSRCYGVALTIYAGNKQATRRVIVTCGPRFG
jgi:hypothetical protein